MKVTQVRIEDLKVGDFFWNFADSAELNNLELREVIEENGRVAWSEYPKERKFLDNVKQYERMTEGVFIREE